MITHLNFLYSQAERYNIYGFFNFSFWTLKTLKWWPRRFTQCRPTLFQSQLGLGRKSNRKTKIYNCPLQIRSSKIVFLSFLCSKRSSQVTANFKFVKNLQSCCIRLIFKQEWSKKIRFIVVTVFNWVKICYFNVWGGLLFTEIPHPHTYDLDRSELSNLLAFTMKQSKFVFKTYTPSNCNYLSSLKIYTVRQNNLKYNFDMHTTTTHSNIQLLHSYVALVRQLTPLPTTRSVFKMGGLPTVCQKLADNVKCLWRCREFESTHAVPIASDRLLGNTRLWSCAHPCLPFPVPYSWLCLVYIKAHQDL